MLVDTHAHLNFSAFKADADAVIRRSLAAGVFLINAGAQYSTSVRAVEYAEKYEGVFAAVGLHPIHIQDEEFDYGKYLELAKKEKVVAIGEMGLDYYHMDADTQIQMDTNDTKVAAIKNRQKEIIAEGIKLANEVQRPMMLHCREAYDDLLEILQNNPAEKKGVIHCFVGSWKVAQKFIKLGYKIGLNGIITYSPSYDKLIKNISLEDILLETDCPYLNPQPLPRDGRNEPANARYVAAKIAEIKNISAEEVAAATTQTAQALFDLVDFSKVRI